MENIRNMKGAKWNYNIFFRFTYSIRNSTDMVETLEIRVGRWCIVNVFAYFLFL